MNPGCAHCGASLITQYCAWGGEGFLCRECARRDILGWWVDLDSDERKLMRRRIEDRLRKDRATATEVAVNLIINGEINYYDVM